MTPETDDGDDGDDVTSGRRETGGSDGTDPAPGKRRQPEGEEAREEPVGENGGDLATGDGEDLAAGDGQDRDDRDGEGPDGGDGEMAVEGRSELDDEGRSELGDEGPVRTLNGRVRLKWYGQVVLTTAILAAVGLGLSIVVDPVAPWMVAAVLVPLLALGLLWVRLRYRMWAFQFRADHLFLERGVYRNVETAVPYVRIQHVDTSRGPVERVLGLSTLVVYTAGSRGADVAIPGLPRDEAEAMQDRVKELAIAAEGGEGL